MNSRSKRKIWVTLILIIAPLAFITLIIFATPFFYSIHPNANTDGQTETSEKTIYSVQDTIIISNDSTISHQFTIAETCQHPTSSTPSIENLGTFGDSAGFWNAIFSAVAMIGVVYTIFYQFNRDRDNDERIAIAQFQDQFFKMISILSDIVSELRISINEHPAFSYHIPDNIGYDMPDAEQTTLTPTDPDKNITGRACFQYIYHQKPDGKNVGEFIANEIGYDQNAVASEELYKSLRKIIGNHFDHYFRTIYRILKFIDDIDLGNCNAKKQAEVKNLCADLLRAQLSTFELALIYYNGLYPQFRGKSKKLYERYCIFDNLDPQILILRSEKDYYEYVRTHHKNKVDYNPTIHYEFTAFTSSSGKIGKGKTTTQNSQWLRFLKCPLKLCHWGHNTTASSQSQEEINNDAKAIYTIIKEHEREIITNDKFISLSRLTKKQVTSALKFLKKNGNISSKKKRRGTKFKVLKKYP